MRTLRKIPSPKTKDQEKINQLIDQTNQQKEEIRLIKKKLRVNAHF